MHFFNPAPVMKLIEVIPGINTPQETVDKVIAIANEIGKTPVEVKEGAGFVVNRILIPLVNEGVGTVSYTHLDVYKRQPHPLYIKVFDRSGRRFFLYK